MRSEVAATLVCPHDRTRLSGTDDRLTCEQGHRFPVCGGIPVLVLDDAPGMHVSVTRALDEDERAEDLALDDGETPPPTMLHPFVREMQGATSGAMFHAARDRFTTYPIPELRLPDGAGKRLLDIGCAWGRWSIAAARKGYRVTGVDHNFGRLVIARRVCRQLGVEADFLCTDARRLPFADGSFDVAFSYSVVQHFSKDQARLILAEVGRVLAAGGAGMIQMPNRYGIRSLYHQLRKTWTPAQPFDVRYWTPRELLRDFEAAIGPSRLTIDGFFGLGIQARDSENFLPHHRAIVGLSERLRRAPWLAPVADSLYVHSAARTPHSTT